MGFKKKLHINPEKEVETHLTKRETKRCITTPVSIERDVRELLVNKVSGTLMGLWLLIPEHLRLGTWDLLKGWSKSVDYDIEPRLAMQMVHESAVCVNGIRRKRSFCNQGFELANGLPFIATDKQIHDLLDRHTIAESQALQIALGKIRQVNGHYKGNLLALDPHRIITYSKRTMPKKKKRADEPSKKMIQVFFCIDTQTGQPVAFTIGSNGRRTTKASLELIEMIKYIIPSEALLLADKEHFTGELIDAISKESKLDILIPAQLNKKILKTIEKLNYLSKWPGYAVAETTYRIENTSNEARLIAQRTGENEKDFEYKAFITTDYGIAVDLLSKDYPGRWTIEEFFNFESALGWNRASTLNLNIRYGKSTLSLIAQAVIYQLRQKLPKPYKNWTAEHMADSIFNGIDGDIRVKNDTIIVTFYNFPENLNLKKYYENLPEKLEAENVDPHIPWLYNLKLNFKFK